MNNDTPLRLFPLKPQIQISQAIILFFPPSALGRLTSLLCIELHYSNEHPPLVQTPPSALHCQQDAGGPRGGSPQ
jgi:hypothetical protein